MTRENDDRATTRAALVAAGAFAPGKGVSSEVGAQFERAVLSLTAEIPSVVPPLEWKQRILDLLPPVESPLLFRQKNDAAFKPSHLSGISYRMLHADRARHQFTALIRMAPGTVLRDHDHAAEHVPEECLVLEGELIVGDVVMRAGDYQRAAPGSHHVEQRTDTGALLYFSGSLDFLAS